MNNSKGTKYDIRHFSDHDKKMIKAFYVCFDRPAFRLNFEHEADLDDLIDALDDTIAAINTGVKKRRDGIVFGENTEGKAYFESKELRKAFDEIVTLLTEAKLLYFDAKRSNFFFDMRSIGRSGMAFHGDHSEEACRVAVAIDEIRNRVLEIANNIYAPLGMMEFPYIKTPEHYRKSSNLSPLKKEKPKSKYHFWALNDIFELKPNFFGIGINLNALLNKTRKKTSP